MSSFEELGVELTINEPFVLFRKMQFKTKSGENFISDERYFVVKVPDEKVNYKNMSEIEKELTRDGRWWSVDDLRLSTNEFFMNDLDMILEAIINNKLKNTPQEI